LRITLATKTRTSLVKGLLQEKTYVSVGSGFNFSHSNCQGSPLYFCLSAAVERTEEYHQTFDLSSAKMTKPYDAWQTKKKTILGS
jgi:hypothetical protein